MIIRYYQFIVHLVVLWCLFDLAKSDSTGNSTNTTDPGQCSNHCSQQDEDDSCWRKTEHYYDVNLINTMNDWVTVQINIDQWNRRKKQEIPIENATELTMSRLGGYLPSDPVLDTDHLREVVLSLLNLTYTKSPEKKDLGIPEFVCPIPCGYDAQLWQYLFVASILVNVAMILVVIPFIIKSERRDKKLYAKQISMMQMLKPASKSRNPSSS